MSDPASKTTRPLPDENWIYWQKLVSDEHDRQTAEIERLRSALGKIARRYPVDTAENMVRFAKDTLGDGWMDA